MRTTLKFDGAMIACGSIDPLPGSSQVAVFHSAFVLPQYRNSGHGEKAHYERLQTAKEQMYNYAIVTVNATNSAQIAILKKWGWRELDSFVSDKTQHTVLIFGRTL